MKLLNIIDPQNCQNHLNLFKLYKLSFFKIFRIGRIAQKSKKIGQNEAQFFVCRILISIGIGKYKIATVKFCL